MEGHEVETTFTGLYILDTVPEFEQADNEHSNYLLEIAKQMRYCLHLYFPTGMQIAWCQNLFYGNNETLVLENVAIVGYAYNGRPRGLKLRRHLTLHRVPFTYYPIRNANYIPIVAPKTDAGNERKLGG